MIEKIVLNDFRVFNGLNINLGENITVISGRNGIGKSTILAVLGNSCELKNHKTIFEKSFRTEFSEILKGDEEFDPVGSDKASIHFSYNNGSEKSVKVCRITWQKETRKGYENSKRFRLIPETKEGKTNSRKEEFPSYYLGLSRLYPVGEFDEKNKLLKNKVILDEDEVDFFIKNYKDILSLNLNINDISSLKTSLIRNKTAVGIDTENYSSITNSAGQDNLGQLILAVMSFKRLKQSYKDYKGGLLLIDELDATLHPSAQIKLFDFLLKISKSLDLQIVFTTHSETLLEHTCTKINGSNSSTNSVKLIYLGQGDNSPMIWENPSFSGIKSDLRISKPGDSLNKVKIYLEDDEAFWLAKNLLKDYTEKIELVSLGMGCSSIINLYERDPFHFANILFLFDGDAYEENKNRFEKNKKMNFLFLPPNNKRPENLIYDFLVNLESENEIFKNGFEYGFTKNIIENTGPLSNEYGNGKERDKYKDWFNDNISFIEKFNVIELWIKNNSSTYDKFIDKFIRKYNIIANRTCCNIIT